MPRPWACPGRAANTAVLAEGARLLIDDPARFEGVRVVGVDEHVWRHTPYGDTYVTVILDVRPVHDRSGPSRLLGACSIVCVSVILFERIDA